MPENSCTLLMERHQHHKEGARHRLMTLMKVEKMRQKKD